MTRACAWGGCSRAFESNATRDAKKLNAPMQKNNARGPRRAARPPAGRPRPRRPGDASDAGSRRDRPRVTRGHAPDGLAGRPPKPPPLLPQIDFGPPGRVGVTGGQLFEPNTLLVVSNKPRRTKPIEAQKQRHGNVCPENGTNRPTLSQCSSAERSSVTPTLATEAPSEPPCVCLSPRPPSPQQRTRRPVCAHRLAPEPHSTWP